MTASVRAPTEPISPPPAGSGGAPALRHPMATLRVGALLTAIVGIGALSIDTFLPSLPAIARQFRTDDATAQLTVTLFLASFAAAQLVFGPLSDRLGRRRTLLAGLALYVAGAATSAVAPGAGVLVLARVAQGLGAGSGPVVGRAIVRDVYPREHGARVLALMATAQALTPILAPILGGWMHAAFGWRSVFALHAVLGAAFAAGAARLVAETAPRHDPAGPRLLGAARTLLADRAFAGFALAIALVFGGQFAFISGSAFVLIDVLHVTPQGFGLCFGLVAFGLMTGAFLAARATARLGARRLVLRGGALSAAAGVAMAALVLAGSTTVPGIVAPMYLYAVGAGAAMPSGMAGAIGPFPRMAGLASALLGFVQMAGSAGYAIAVSRFYDGTARPMAIAIALAGIACLAASTALLRDPARDGTLPR